MDVQDVYKQQMTEITEIPISAETEYRTCTNIATSQNRSLSQAPSFTYLPTLFRCTQTHTMHISSSTASSCLLPDSHLDNCLCFPVVYFDPTESQACRASWLPHQRFSKKIFFFKSQDPFILLKVIKGLKELLFMWVKPLFATSENKTEKFKKYSFFQK